MMYLDWSQKASWSKDLKEEKGHSDIWAFQVGDTMKASWSKDLKEEKGHLDIWAFQVGDTSRYTGVPVEQTVGGLVCLKRLSDCERPRSLEGFYSNWKMTGLF